MIPYETYDVVAFAQDQSFIRWVLDKKGADKRFWEQWVLEHPEKAALIKEATQMVESFQFQEKVLPAAEKEDLWASITSGIENQEEKGRIKKLPIRRFSYAAAILLLLVASYFIWLSQSMTSIQSSNGEWLTHNLPDNTKVELNAASQIQYQRKKWQEERTIDLKGEAMFDVVEGRPFVVNTSLGKVEVLGTEFNVYTREDVLRVECFSGRVRVSSLDKNIILTKGQSVLIQREVMDSASFELTEKQNWRDGLFEYDEATFKEVFEEMERQFDIVINTSEEIAILPYHGFFENDDLNRAFNAVCFTQGLEAEEERPGVYRIKKRE